MAMREWFQKTEREQGDGADELVPGARKDKLKNRLTLSVDDNIKEAAKAYADRLGTSVSALVEAYLGQIAGENDVPRRRATEEDLASLPTKAATAPGGSLGLRGMPETAGAYYDDGTLLVDEDNPLSLSAIQLRAMLRAEGHKVEKELLVPLATVKSANSSDGSAMNKRNSIIMLMQHEFLNLLQEATAKRAEDIYISVGRYEAAIDIRLGGVINHLRQVPVSWAAEFCAAAFNMSDTSDSSYRNLEYQTARLSEIRTPLPKGVQAVRLHFAPLPNGGRHLTMHPVYITSAAESGELMALGLSSAQTSCMRQAARLRTGLCILSGWEGNGISTTMQRVAGLVSQERGDGAKIVSVEDPPEFIIPGAAQFPVPYSTTPIERTESYCKAVLHALSTRPDVCFVSNIRDARSARIVTDAASKGTQMWCSLVANDAMGALARLRDMEGGMISGYGMPLTVYWQCLLAAPGEDAVLLGDLMRNGLDDEQTALAERLTECGVALDRVKITPAGVRYPRRLLACELLQPSTELLRLLDKGDFSSMRSLAEEEGFVPARVHAARLVEAGKADPYAAFAAFGNLMT
jgi:type II secretory ATPase GspE/PulE/Tfp pilus assembly ATPase PilB-like protein